MLKSAEKLLTQNFTKVDSFNGVEMRLGKAQKVSILVSCEYFSVMCVSFDQLVPEIQILHSETFCIILQNQ